MLPSWNHSHGKGDKIGDDHFDRLSFQMSENWFKSFLCLVNRKSKQLKLKEPWPAKDRGRFIQSPSLGSSFVTIYLIVLYVVNKISKQLNYITISGCTFDLTSSK